MHACRDICAERIAACQHRPLPSGPGDSTAFVVAPVSQGGDIVRAGGLLGPRTSCRGALAPGPTVHFHFDWFKSSRGVLICMHVVCFERMAGPGLVCSHCRRSLWSCGRVLCCHFLLCNGSLVVTAFRWLLRSYVAFIRRVATLHRTCCTCCAVLGLTAAYSCRLAAKGVSHLLTYCSAMCIAAACYDAPLHCVLARSPCRLLLLLCF